MVRIIIVNFDNVMIDCPHSLSKLVFIVNSDRIDEPHNIEPACMVRYLYFYQTHNVFLYVQLTFKKIYTEKWHQNKKKK